MHVAAGGGHVDVVQALRTAGERAGMFFFFERGVNDERVCSGGDVNAMDKRGWSPMHLAACNGHLKVVQVLHTAGERRDVFPFLGKCVSCLCLCLSVPLSLCLSLSLSLCLSLSLHVHAHVLFFSVTGVRLSRRRRECQEQQRQHTHALHC